MSTRKNAAYNIAYRVFSLLLPIITAPYLARTVGQEGTGLYAYAWSVSAVFVLLGMLGLENYGVRAVARVKDDQQQLDRTFSEIYQMQWLTAGAALVLYVGYVCFIAGAEKQIAAWLTLMSVSCLVNLDWLLMGLDQIQAHRPAKYLREIDGHGRRIPAGAWARRLVEIRPHLGRQHRGRLSELLEQRPGTGMLPSGAVARRAEASAALRGAVPVGHCRAGVPHHG